ncbi:MAG: biotin transporter BioY, partial [Thermoanaerobaculia bacterium]
MLDERVARGRAVTNVMLVIAGSALIAIAAQIAIDVPFSPVPLTMQPMAVLLVGIVLGSKRGAAAATLYLLEG